MSVDSLRGKEFSGYLRNRIPHKLDDVVQRVVLAFLAGSPPVRRAMLQKVSPAAADVLSAYGERMAAMAVRAGSSRPLQHALVAMGMAESRLEYYRMNLFVLATVNHSAELIGTTLSAVIDEVADSLPASAVATFHAFSARRDDEKSLQSMGLGVCGEGETFRYGYA